MKDTYELKLHGVTVAIGTLEEISTSIRADNKKNASLFKFNDNGSKVRVALAV